LSKKKVPKIIGNDKGIILLLSKKKVPKIIGNDKGIQFEDLEGCMEMNISYLLAIF